MPDAEDTECVRGISVAALPSSLESCASSFGGSDFKGESRHGDSYTGAPDPKWRASTDPRSSIGVKILRDLDWDDSDLGCGGD